jgi:hypothetical protein
VGLGLAALPARADDAPPVRLEWIAPSPCPGQSDVLAAVNRILGSGGGVRQAVVARATVSKSGPRWRVALTTRAANSEGERTIEAATCRTLADAAALVIALAASPEARPHETEVPLSPPPPSPLPGSSSTPAASTALSASVSTSPASSTPTATTTATATPTAIAAAPPSTLRGTPTAAPAATAGAPPTPAPPAPPGSTATASPTSRRLALSLSGVGEVGPMPSFATGGEAVLAVRLWRLRVEGGAAYWANQVSAVPATTQTADFSMVSVVWRAGYTAPLGRFELVPSLVGEAELMNAVAQNVSTPNPSSSTWFELGAGGWVFWSVTREFAIRLGLDAAFPFARPTFQVGEGTRRTTVFHVPPLGGKGAIGLELRFL